MNLIQAEPDARPEAVERARALVTDPSFPSNAVIDKVARAILGEYHSSSK